MFCHFEKIQDSAGHFRAPQTTKRPVRWNDARASTSASMTMNNNVVNYLGEFGVVGFILLRIVRMVRYRLMYLSSEQSQEALLWHRVSIVLISSCIIPEQLIQLGLYIVLPATVTLVHDHISIEWEFVSRPVCFDNSRLGRSVRRSTLHALHTTYNRKQNKIVHL